MKRAIVLLLVIPMSVAVFAGDASKALLTMISMHDIGLAWEAFATDHNSYLKPELAKLLPVTQKEEPRKWTDLILVPKETVQTMLAPTYIRSVPMVDAWGTPFEFGDDNAMKIFLPAEGVAVRARAGIDSLYPEPFKKLLQTISAGADDVAKIINR